MGAASLGRTRQLEFSGHSTREERAHRERNLEIFRRFLLRIQSSIDQHMQVRKLPKVVRDPLERIRG